MKWVLKGAVAAMAASSALALAFNDHLPGSVEKLQVVEPAFYVADDTRVLTTLGSIQNLAPEPMGDIVVEARFFDAKGKLIDTVTQPLRGIVVPGGSKVAFRTDDHATRLKAEYASQEVRVASAEVLGPVEKSAGWLLWDYFLSWFPLLVLIAVFVWFAKRGRVAQSLAVTVLERQNELLERLLESRDKPDAGKPGN